MRLPLLLQISLHTCLPALLLLQPAMRAAGAQPAPAPAPVPPDTVSQLVDSLSAVRMPSSAALSPDGASVAWAFQGSAGSELHVTAVAPGHGDRPITPTPNALSGKACTAAHPAWSPDGRQLAFLSDCTGTPAAPDPAKQDNLWLWSPGSNTYRQISHLRGAVSDLRWSPDSRYIAFLYVENATRRAGALDAMKPPSGVIGEDGVEIQRVFAIDIATDHGKFISYSADSRSPSLHVYEFTWSPDAQHIALVAAPPPGENNWWTARLYTEAIGSVSACNGAGTGALPGRSCTSGSAPPDLPHLVFDPTSTPGPLHGLQIAVPRFSPNGDHIAFIGGLMSDQGSTGGDIYVVPTAGLPAGTEPKDLTPNRPASPAWIDWRTPHQLILTEHAGGSSHITALDPATGKDDPGINLTLPETIIAGSDVLSLSLGQTPAPASGAPTAAFIRESFSRPPEVWAGPLTSIDHLTQVSHLNDALKPLWGPAESVTWTDGGFPIQGWLLYPAHYEPTRRYPLVVSIHGGPSSAVTPRWPTASYGAVPFSALGYFVFLPNPRGSFGQGEAFTRANVKDFGYGDLHDILAGLDTLQKRLPIDPSREGVTGWSYGGFMTMFAVTQTTRFRAAVAGAGVADWLSYYGENSIDQWMIPFFGASVYNDPAIYAKSSPIDFIKNVRTPTLIVVGDRDGECPAPQSFEFWHALREQGVSTRLVVYPDEGHRFVNPAHRKDVLTRALDWFNTQMPEKP